MQLKAIKMKRKRKLCDDLEECGAKRKRHGSSIGNIMPTVITPGRTKSATITRTNSLRMLRLEWELYLANDVGSQSPSD